MPGNPFGEIPLGLVSQILSLSSILLRPVTLRIPPFQRPYTWTTREVGQLIADLRTALDNKSTFYFIGQIVFIRDGKFLDIADGQQRLTTLTMIMAYARDRLVQHAKLFQSLVAAADGGAGGRIQLRPAEADFFHYWVQTPGRMRQLADLTDFTTDSQECLILAAREIADALDAMDAAALETLIRFIARCTTMNVIDADEAGGAATVFETMHNRGKTLSQPDILKGVLLNSRDLSADDVKEAARIWELKEERSGSRENFARLLRYIPLLLGAGPIISPGDVGALRETIAKRVGVKRFLLEVLPRLCDVHRDLINVAVQAGPDTSDVQRRIKCLQLLQLEDWEPLAIAFLAARAERPEKVDSTQRFFLVYERLMAGANLRVFDNRVLSSRIDRAFRSIVLDSKPLLTIASDLEITNKMREDLLERVSRSSNRDPHRRYLMWRVNAIFGEVLRMRVDDANVEHVLPRTPTQWWLQYFPSDPKLYNAYSNMIANYLLVTDKQDDEAGQRTFPEKLDVYFRRGFPVRAITRTIENVTEWNRQTLERRQEWLCGQISVEWDLAIKP